MTSTAMSSTVQCNKRFWRLKQIGAGASGHVYKLRQRSPPLVIKAYHDQSACKDAHDEFKVQQTIYNMFESTPYSKDLQFPKPIVFCKLLPQEKAYKIAKGDYYCYAVMSQLRGIPLKQLTGAGTGIIQPAGLQKKIGKNAEIMLHPQFNPSHPFSGVDGFLDLGYTDWENGRSKALRGYYISSGNADNEFDSARAERFDGLMKKWKIVNAEDNEQLLTYDKIQEIEGFVYGWFIYGNDLCPADIEFTINPNGKLNVMDFGLVKPISHQFVAQRTRNQPTPENVLTYVVNQFQYGDIHNEHFKEGVDAAKTAAAEQRTVQLPRRQRHHLKTVHKVATDMIAYANDDEMKIIEDPANLEGNVVDVQAFDNLWGSLCEKAEHIVLTKGIYCDEDIIKEIKAVFASRYGNNADFEDTIDTIDYNLCCEDAFKEKYTFKGWKFTIFDLQRLCPGKYKEDRLHRKEVRAWKRWKKNQKNMLQVPHPMKSEEELEHEANMFKPGNSGQKNLKFQTKINEPAEETKEHEQEHEAQPQYKIQINKASQGMDMDYGDNMMDIYAENVDLSPVVLRDNRNVYGGGTYLVHDGYNVKPFVHDQNDNGILIAVSLVEMILFGVVLSCLCVLMYLMILCVIHKVSKSVNNDRNHWEKEEDEEVNNDRIV